MYLFASNLRSYSELSDLCVWGSFAGIVQGGALSSICTQILAMVNQEQDKVLWIPACPL